MKEMIGLAPASSFDTYHSFVVYDFVNYLFENNVLRIMITYLQSKFE